LIFKPTVLESHPFLLSKSKSYKFKDTYYGKLKCEGDCRSPSNLHGIFKTLSFF